MLTVLTLRYVLTSYYNRPLASRLVAKTPLLITALENDIIKGMTDKQDDFTPTQAQTRALITFWQSNKDAFNEFQHVIEYELAPTLDILALLDGLATLDQQVKLLDWMNSFDVKADTVKHALEALKAKHLLSEKNVTEIINKPLTQNLFTFVTSMFNMYDQHIKVTPENLHAIFDLCITDIDKADMLSSTVKTLKKKGAFQEFCSIDSILPHIKHILYILQLAELLDSSRFYTTRELSTLNFVLSQSDSDHFGYIIQSFICMNVQNKKDISLDIFQMSFQYPDHYLSIRCALEQINSKKTIDASDCAILSSVLARPYTGPPRDMTAILVREWEAKKPVSQPVLHSQGVEMIRSDVSSDRLSL